MQTGQIQVGLCVRRIKPDRCMIVMQCRINQVDLLIEITQQVKHISFVGIIGYTFQIKITAKGGSSQIYQSFKLSVNCES